MADQGENKEADRSMEGDNKREYIRVLAENPVIYRIASVSGPDTREGRHRSIFHIPSLPYFDGGGNKYGAEDRSDQQILELILGLDWKLNYLFKILAKAEDSKVFPHQGVMIDLSASGMRFSTSTKVASGMLLECEFILPILPFHEIVLTGEVLRCFPIENQGASSQGSSSEEYDVAVEFKGMKEPDRDHIIRYVIRRQLQIQRESSR